MTGQRCCERVEFFCPVKLKMLPDGPTISANSFDISLGGIGLISPVFVERGKDIRVQLRVKNGQNEYTYESALGRVAYSRAEVEGNRLGIEFMEYIHESTQPELTKKLNAL